MGEGGKREGRRKGGGGLGEGPGGLMEYHESNRIAVVYIHYCYK